MIVFLLYYVLLFFCDKMNLITHQTWHPDDFFDTQTAIIDRGVSNIQ